MTFSRRPLLPAPLRSIPAGKPSSNSSSIVTKRASTGGKVACEPCRARKIACDCTHPVCYKCVRNGAECVYRPFQGTSALKRRLHDQGREFGLFVARLKSLREDEALSLIRRLHAVTDLHSALVMAQDPCDAVKPPLLRIHHRPLLPLTEPEVELELTTLHPVIYPILLPISYQLPSPSPAPHCFDPHLRDLQIGYWTAVPIDDSEAVRLFSHYFERDHPCIPLFNKDLFLNDLIDHKSTYCSAFLVSSLLYLACQAHHTDRPDQWGITLAFFNEAKRLWDSQQSSVTPLNLTASQILSLGCLLQGKDKLSRHLVFAGRAMAEELGLLNQPVNSPKALTLQKLSSPSTIDFMCHLAWGVYTWFTLHVINYRDEPISLPPVLPFPGEVVDSISSLRLSCVQSRPSCTTENTFPHLCQTSPELLAAAFAQSTYHKLLAWSDGLPKTLMRGDHRQSHIVLLHTWFHCTVLDLFRPFCSLATPNAMLKLFSSSEYHPRAIYEASLKQLKHLVQSYCLLQHPSHYSPFIGFSMTHIIGDVPKKFREEDWRDCIVPFFNCWKHLYSAYPLYGDIAQATLSMLLRQGLLSGSEAHDILFNLRQNGQHDVDDIDLRPETSFLIDWNQALTNTEAARITTVARDSSHLTTFEELTMNDDFTVETMW
ncbi:nitrate assimilation regulatory protein nirA [Ophiocordyceps camponoti-floridani]|uniref:Nitrate assimilation regulatory protein nirA n=1 Tax=Ophiocordyceps camponoti-floridani TaxID=2030778 RepID=A0A8H4VAW8_9HYPO|nr:nitrate assimilation regulatory protein nirA [Ophiocordyceps camponoti-floridani]